MHSGTQQCWGWLPDALSSGLPSCHGSSRSSSIPFCHQQLDKLVFWNQPLPDLPWLAQITRLTAIPQTRDRPPDLTRKSPACPRPCSPFLFCRHQEGQEWPTGTCALGAQEAGATEVRPEPLVLLGPALPTAVPATARGLAQGGEAWGLCGPLACAALPSDGVVMETCSGTTKHDY